MNKRLINILFIAAKVATGGIDNPYSANLVAEIIDLVREGIDFEKKIPDIESVLKENGKSDFEIEEVRYLLEETNLYEYFMDDFSKDLSDEIRKLDKTRYSDDNLQGIINCLALYGDRCKQWYVNNNSFKKDKFARLDKILSGQAKTLENHEKRISSLEQIANYTVPTNIFSESDFYRYFKFEPDFTVDRYFLTSNYYIKKLTDNNDKLEKALLVDKPIDFNTIKNLVNSQNILMVTGLYGSGKTALLKRLCYELRKEKVLYFESNNLKEIIEEIINREKIDVSKAIKKLSEMIKDTYGLNDFSKVYIFIDLLDELNMSTGEGKSTTYLECFIKWLCKTQSNNTKFHFVLASRMYAEISKVKPVCVADQLFAEYYDEGKTEMYVIHTEPFKNDDVAKWISMYSECKKTPIYEEVIRKTKLREAMRCPLFLFVFYRRYMNNSEMDLNRGYYYYYNTFIEDTIQGRFCKGNSNKGINDKEEYRDFLERLAYSIFIGENERLCAFANEFYKNTIDDEQPLLAEELLNMKLGLSVAELNDLMNDSDVVSKAKRINAYFLSIDKSYIHFTDTNILFSLAAEYLYKSINEMAHKRKGFTEQNLDEIKLSGFYPQLIDFVVFKFQDDEDNRDSNLFYLDSFVTNNNIRSHNVNLNTGTSVVERILLLYILFIKNYQGSYNNRPYAHILKEILYYKNVYVMNEVLKGNEKPIYTVERYFMDTVFMDATIRRANFNNYNFSRSRIYNGEFIQCCFNFQTTFRNVVLENTTFELCKFDKLKNESFRIEQKGNSNNKQATFKNCEIIESELRASNVEFINCSITNCKVVLEKQRKIVFRNCFINQLTIDYINHNAILPHFEKCIFIGKPKIKDLNETQRRDVNNMIKITTENTLNDEEL